MSQVTKGHVPTIVWTGPSIVLCVHGAVFGPLSDFFGVLRVLRSAVAVGCVLSDCVAHEPNDPFPFNPFPSPIAVDLFVALCFLLLTIF